MSRIKRQKPPKHILIPDTNVLWHDQKDVCVSPEFSTFWEGYGAKYEIELVIPDVVKGELLYQHTSSALITLDRINKQFDALSSYVNKTYKHKINVRQVKDDIRYKFESWVSSLSAEVVGVPVGEIDWDNIIYNSIWRLPPFSEDKDKKNEKGFRDAIILETVCYVSKSRKDIDIAFISNDRVLVGAANHRLKGNEKYSSYETLDEFSSYLRLLEEELTNDFVQEIQKRARAKFYSENKSDSLIFKEQIIPKIREKFQALFMTPIAYDTWTQALSGSSMTKNETWEPNSKEGVRVGAPSFLRLEGENDFIWDSRVKFVQLFKYSGQTTGTLLTDALVHAQENLRDLEFQVIWKAKVGKDARFRKMELLEIKLATSKFEPALDEDKQRYGIRSKAD